MLTVLCPSLASCDSKTIPHSSTGRRCSTASFSFFLLPPVVYSHGLTPRFSSRARRYRRTTTATRWTEARSYGAPVEETTETQLRCVARPRTGRERKKERESALSQVCETPFSRFREPRPTEFKPATRCNNRILVYEASSASV